jgi:hypothetical protein
VQPNRGRYRPGRYVVSTAKGRQEIVNRLFVGKIDNCQSCTQFVFIAAKQIVLSDGDVEKVARGDTRPLLGSPRPPQKNVS